MVLHFLRSGLSACIYACVLSRIATVITKNNKVVLITRDDTLPEKSKPVYNIYNVFITEHMQRYLWNLHFAPKSHNLCGCSAKITIHLMFACTPTHSFVSNSSWLLNKVMVHVWLWLDPQLHVLATSAALPSVCRTKTESKWDTQHIVSSQRWTHIAAIITHNPLSHGNEAWWRPKLSTGMSSLFIY